MDYQKLSQSLNTIDKNETELKKEYTRLYDLAESNRKRLIADWNTRFAPNQQIPADGKYIQGDGTASIDGAIRSMPRHKFSEIIVGVDTNGNVGATYPNPAWGYYNDDDGKGINLDAVREALKHTERYTFRADERSHDFGVIHKVKEVDAGPAIDAAYNAGVEAGKAQSGFACVNANLWNSHLEGGNIVGFNNDDKQWNKFTSVKLPAGSYRFVYAMTNMGASSSVTVKGGDNEWLKIEAGSLKTQNDKHITWDSFAQGTDTCHYAGGSFVVKLTKETTVMYKAYCYDGYSCMTYTKI